MLNVPSREAALHRGWIEEAVTRWIEHFKVSSALDKNVDHSDTARVDMRLHFRQYGACGRTVEVHQQTYRDDAVILPGQSVVAQVGY